MICYRHVRQEANPENDTYRYGRTQSTEQGRA